MVCGKVTADRSELAHAPATQEARARCTMMSCCCDTHRQGGWGRVHGSLCTKIMSCVWRHTFVTSVGEEPSGWVVGDVLTVNIDMSWQLRDVMCLGRHNAPMTPSAGARCTVHDDHAVMSCALRNVFATSVGVVRGGTYCWHRHKLALCVRTHYEFVKYS